MSYDVSDIFGEAPAPSLNSLNGLENIMQGPTITSTMFSPDDNNIIFPPGALKVGGVKYTYASFHREQYASIPDEISDSWELIVPVEIPTNFIIPKLLSLEYTLKYATAHDRGNSTLQSDIVLTTASLPSGVRKLKQRDHEVYRDTENVYGPRAVKKDVAWNLVTSFGVKPKGGPEWSHYIDHQRIRLCIQLTRLTTNLYFVLSARDYPSSATMDSIAVEITSKWEGEDASMITLPSSYMSPVLRAPSLAPSRAESPRSVGSEYFQCARLETSPSPPQRESPVLWEEWIPQSPSEFIQAYRSMTPSAPSLRQSPVFVEARMPSPVFVEARTPSPLDFISAYRPVTPPAPPQRQTADALIQALRAAPRRRGSPVLCERIYAPSPDSCEEEMI